jgi:hypothetical protein
MAEDRKYVEFSIDMVVSINKPTDLTEDTLTDLFIQWVESHGLSAGGAIRQLTEEDYARIDSELEEFTNKVKTEE